MHNIIVIDSRPDGRGKAMAATFTDIPGVHVKWVYNVDGAVKASQLTCGYIESGKALLRLVHRNQEEARIYCDAAFEAEVTIWYSGAEGLLLTDEDKIWRNILGDDSVITKAEAEDLLNYAVRRRGNPDAEKPALLKPPPRLDCTLALRILCEGYLLTHISFWDHAENSQARLLRKQLGFDANTNALGQITDISFDSRKTSAERADWWLAPFRDQDGDNPSRDSLQKALKDECLGCDFPIEIYSLLDAIFSDSPNALIGCSQVVNAYLILAKKLEDRKQL